MADTKTAQAGAPVDRGLDATVQELFANGTLFPPGTDSAALVEQAIKGGTDGILRQDEPPKPKEEIKQHYPR